MFVIRNASSFIIVTIVNMSDFAVYRWWELRVVGVVSWLLLCGFVEC